jgi:hypothetical protein
MGLFGQFAGIILALSFILAWGVTFVPWLLGRPRVALRVGVVSGVYLAWYFVDFFFTPTFGSSSRGPDACGKLVMGVIFVLAYEGVSWLWVKSKPWTPLPECSIIFLMVVAWVPLSLHHIAHDMWTGYPPGGVRDPTSLGLAVMHLFVIAMALFLSVQLWIASARKTRPVVVAMSAGAFLSLLLSGLAFYLTVPRGGDEGLMCWLFLVPGGILVALFSLASCLGAPALCVTKASRRTVEQVSHPASGP